MADDAADTQQQLRLLRQQNEVLQEQLRKQQELIDSLSRAVRDIQAGDVKRSHEVEDLKSEVTPPDTSYRKSSGFSLGKINISGEGGVGYFHTGSEGFAPKGEFRVDEARLFVEAPIWNDVYFYSELNLMTREAEDFSVQLGEIYLDFENVSKLWNQDRMLNIRAGRMYIPFGEEYQYRFAIDNPLISHSLTDLWGSDEGVELYGKIGKLSYSVAVQNGGPMGNTDFSGDKSVAGRVSYDPSRWLHLSVSAMRTGQLELPQDYWSALWLANGWIVPIGSTNTTRFEANLVEGDVEFRLPHGHIKAFGGYIRYDDNDTLSDNKRHIYYYSVEGAHDLTRKLYAAARFSQIFAENGYPITGNGSPDLFQFNPLTDEIWRLSLGLGYRFSENLVVKTEYSFERGKETDGGRRNKEDLFSLVGAFRF